MADNLTDPEFGKAPYYTKHEAAPGVRISPGPYVGIVKGNSDPTRSGKLQVWIAELGGAENDEGSWKTVSYCTPFYGITPRRSSDSPPNSYGMWFVPPDTGVKVLCTFANGNPFDGYWFGCIPEYPHLQMVPAISGKVDGSSPPPLQEAYFDPSTNNLSKLANPADISDRTTHTAQESIWQAQGLLNDPDRGPGTSSAVRETPSYVFGISTPGQSANSSDPQDLGAQDEKLSGVYGSGNRKGGHTFVMDDGDANGKSQMMRLRTAAGHMIMMNDTKDFIYVINSKGTAWVEINSTGDINVFSAHNVNIASKGDMSFEADGAFKLHAKSIDLLADTNLNLKGKDVNIKGDGNTKISGKTGLHLKAQNTYLTGDSCLQIKSDGHIDLKGSCHTINTADAKKAQEAGDAQKPSNMPGKEPWTGHNSGGSPTANQPSYGQQQGLPGGTSSGPYGATNNFGSSNVQQNYADITNNIPPVTYTNNPISFSGAGSNSGDYTPTGFTQSGISAAIAGGITGAIIGSLINSGGSSYNVKNSSSGGTNASLTVGEKQNNPGNLPYSKNDKYASGYANNLAVYTKPEDGIAALATLFDSYNLSTTTLAIDLVVKFLNAKSQQDPNVTDMTRFMTTALGITSSTHVGLKDPTTRITWVVNVIRYVQKGIIYTYDQVISGCAMSLGMTVTDFMKGVQPVTQPWQNSNGTNPYSGFVNTAKTPSVQNNGSSPLTTIATKVVNNLLNNVIGGVSYNVGSAVGSAVSNYTNSAPTPSVSPSTLGTTPGQTAYTDYLGQSVGSGQCVALVQAASPVGNTSSWVPGNSVLNGTTQPGTVIACGFTGPGGAYANQSGVSHAAIFLGYQYDTNGNISGIRVQDQWAGHACGTRTIGIDQAKAEGAQNFSEVTHDGSTAIQANGSPQTVTQNQLDTATGNQPTYSDSAQNTSASSPTSEQNAANYDNSGYRDLQATAPTQPYANPGDLATGGYGSAGGSNASQNAAISAASPTSSENSYTYAADAGKVSAQAPTTSENAYNYVTDNQLVSQSSPTSASNSNFYDNSGYTQATNPATISASSPTSSDNAYNFNPPSTNFSPMTTGSANNTMSTTPSEPSPSAMNQLENTTSSRDPIASPDAAAYGDKYSSTIANEPTNTQPIATANPGDIAGGGYGSGNNQSDTGSFGAGSPPDSAVTPTTQATANPGDLAGGGFGSGSSGGTSYEGQSSQSTPTPITGSNGGPGTGGTAGSQAAPGGGAAAGQGASC